MAERSPRNREGQSDRRPSAAGKKKDESRRETSGIVLDEFEDFADFGRGRQSEMTQIIIVLGTTNFTILKIFMRPRLRFELGKEIIIEKLRERTLLIKRQNLTEITATAQGHLFDAVKQIVEKQEKRFVDFFNVAHPLTPKLHQLMLLPGIGPKRMWDVIEKRKTKEFETFVEITQKTEINDPVGIVVKRILEELEGEQKYYLF